jgi:peptide deformylase
MPRCKQLVDDMLETMYAAQGIGLAATQVNVHRQLLVMDISTEHDQPQVYINPGFVARDGVEVSEEGCLSVPNVFEEVERAARVTVRAQDADGASYERELDWPRGGVPAA